MAVEDEVKALFYQLNAVYGWTKVDRYSSTPTSPPCTKSLPIVETLNNLPTTPPLKSFPVSNRTRKRERRYKKQQEVVKSPLAKTPLQRLDNTESPKSLSKGAANSSDSADESAGEKALVPPSTRKILRRRRIIDDSDEDIPGARSSPEVEDRTVGREEEASEAEEAVGSDGDSEGSGYETAMEEEIGIEDRHKSEDKREEEYQEEGLDGDSSDSFLEDISRRFRRLVRLDDKERKEEEEEEVHNSDSEEELSDTSSVVVDLTNGEGHFDGSLRTSAELLSGPSSTTALKRVPLHRRVAPPATQTTSADKSSLLPSASLVSTRKSGSSRTSGLSKAAFTRQRDALVKQALDVFNRKVFEGKLPASLEISWSTRLRKTAGLTYTRKGRVDGTSGGLAKLARVELSEKVVDDVIRLEKICSHLASYSAALHRLSSSNWLTAWQTLLHELCHVAAWLVNGENRPPHGNYFWMWAKKAQRVFPDRLVTRCHDYKIHFKYKYICGDCGNAVGRHSKSLDVSTKICGMCKGKFTLHMCKKDGTTTTPRKPSGFSMFVKQHYSEVRQRDPQVKHSEVLGQLAQRWKELQASTDSTSQQQ